MCVLLAFAVAGFTPQWREIREDARSDYDLGAIASPASVVSDHKNYLLAHVAAMRALRPEWDYVEVPLVHQFHRFGGRPDRLGRLLTLRAVLEVKSGQKTKAHGIQTALQAILAATVYDLPAESWARYGLYLKPSGRFALEPFDKRADFDEARRIIRVCCT